MICPPLFAYTHQGCHYSVTSDKKGHHERGRTTQSIVVPLCYTTLYKITSKRGQPLYKGQKPGSQVCPLFRVQRTKPWVPSVSVIQSTKDKSLGPKCVHYSEYKGQKPGSQVCPLFRVQRTNAGSQVCPLFRVQRTKPWVPSVSIIQSTKDKTLGPKCVHYSEYKGQKPGSQVCPLFRVQRTKAWVPSVSIIWRFHSIGTILCCTLYQSI